MPNGRPVRHEHYVARHQYRATCGHLVSTAKAKKCRDCARGPRKHAHFLGTEGTRSLYRAPCGHVVGNPEADRCMDCRRVKAGRERKGYQKTGRQSEHRLIVERVLGRPLRSNEVVHHINLDKHDNRHRNLLVCDKRYHTYLHRAMERAYAARIRTWQDSPEV